MQKTSLLKPIFICTVDEIFIPVIKISGLIPKSTENTELPYFKKLIKIVKMKSLALNEYYSYKQNYTLHI